MVLRVKNTTDRSRENNNKKNKETFTNTNFKIIFGKQTQLDE